MTLSADAFSDGQISSKLWLCHELETILNSDAWKTRGPFSVRVYAGWAGLLPFLMFSREKVPLRRVELLDLDPKAVANSLRINDHWRIQGRFHAHVHDINQYRPAATEGDWITINTSCEHLEDSTWWDAIPAGSLVVLQGTDMPHHEHVRLFRDLSDFKGAFAPLKRIWFEGTREFRYPHLTFSRFLLIAEKGP